MKRLWFIICVLILTLSACSGVEEELRIPTSEQTIPSDTRLSEAQAMAIANNAVEGLRTRSLNLLPSVEYLKKAEGTRSDDVPDTLAYVFNYPDDAGFAIIAADRRVVPLLAYSDEGHIDVADAFVQQLVIMPVQNYIQNEIENSPNDLFPGIVPQIPTLEWKSPVIRMQLEQGDPWNKYVLANEKKPYVGCVPVANANIISYCLDSIRYYYDEYNLKEMRKAIAVYQGQEGVGTSTYVEFLQAKDQMAKFLWQLGKASKAIYTDKGTTVDKREGALRILNVGCQCPTGIQENYDAERIMKCVRDTCLVYIVGADTTKNERGERLEHAWVCDGYEIKPLIESNPNFTQLYLHFNWGWNRTINAYYAAQMYAVNNTIYEGILYAAFKVESEEIKSNW